MLRAMMTVSVSELRNKMKDVVERVKQGEEVEITQNGEVVSVMLHPSRLRQRVRTQNTIAADNLLQEMARLKNEPFPEPGLSAEYAEDLIRHIRAERDSE